MLYKWYDGKKYRANKKTEAIFINVAEVCITRRNKVCINYQIS